MSKLNAVSLFSGAGGLDIGLEESGFRLGASVELDPMRCKTLRANREAWTVLHRDIRTISGEDILKSANLDEVDLVAAGPPCQPFSKSAYWVTEGKVIDIERSQLIFEPVRIADELGARAVIIENVPGLSYKFARPLLELLLKNLSNSGYDSICAIVDAAEYGVPQHRKRLIVIGMRDKKPRLPSPTNTSSDCMTAGDAIEDLDDGIVAAKEIMKGKHGDLLQLIPPGQNYIFLTERGCGTSYFKYRSRYWSFLLKLSPDLPSWTIPAQAGPYTGPFHGRNRKLRIPELMRLQAFPDEWIFCGSEISIRRQIGDAVPPLLAKRLGEEIIKQLAE
jgi:DNA (cytosine-5)-methyltransferase 1